MFEACHRFAFFDYFRVPCVVRPAGHPAARARVPGYLHRACVPGREGRAPCSLLWAGGDERGAGGAAGRRLGCYRLGGSTVFAHVVPDEATGEVLGALGRGWRPVEAVLAGNGAPVAHVWREVGGSVFLPFDPGEVMHRFWSEKYRDVGRLPLAAAGRRALLRGYYLARPALPRPVQLRLRRAFTRVQERPSFPAWPLEESLHNFYTWLFSLLCDLSGGPVPWLDLWPEGRSCALVLTHDVETGSGYRDMELLRGPERSRGYRSSWNFVPLRYRVHDETVRMLRDEGCEVGVHGLLHDGRDLGSARLVSKRLPAMRQYAARWNAAGFRSPATQRAWELMPRLGFDYDSSYPDTDPYEPQPGGCCTYLPYIHHGMVELPITMPQDHTLFTILQRPDAGIWLRKAQRLRELGGMVLVLSHPDYARDERLTAGYRALLDVFAGDETVWHALPVEAATWWRGRAASTLRPHRGGWKIDGPASAAGRVRLTAPAETRPPTVRNTATQGEGCAGPDCCLNSALGRDSPISAGHVGGADLW